MAKIDTPPITAIGAKAAPIAANKAGQPPLTGIGSKAAPRPGGIGSAAAGPTGMEGEGMFSKILPGGAAEQAGKLGEAISGFGKKFTSFFWGDKNKDQLRTQGIVPEQLLQHLL